MFLVVNGELKWCFFSPFSHISTHMYVIYIYNIIIESIIDDIIYIHINIYVVSSKDQYMFIYIIPILYDLWQL